MRDNEMVKELETAIGEEVSPGGVSRVPRDVLVTVAGSVGVSPDGLAERIAGRNGWAYAIGEEVAEFADARYKLTGW